MMNYEDFYNQCRELIDWRLRDWTDAFGSRNIGKWAKPRGYKSFEDIPLPKDTFEAHEMFCPDYITEEQIMDFLIAENNRLTADIPEGMSAEDLGIRVYAPMKALRQLNNGGKFIENSKASNDIDEILEANEELDFLEGQIKGGYFD